MTIGSGPFGPQIDVTGTSDITQLGGQVERILTSQLEEYGIDLHDGLGERVNEPIVAPDRTVQKAMRYTVDGNDHIWYGDMDGQLVPAHSRVKKRAGTRAWPPCCAYATGRNACSPSNETRTPPTPPWTKASGTSMGSTTVRRILRQAQFQREHLRMEGRGYRNLLLPPSSTMYF